MSWWSTPTPNTSTPTSSRRAGAAAGAPGRALDERLRDLRGRRGLTPGIGHHNVWFSDDYRREFEQLAGGQLADDPTIYGCVSAVTDPTQAPAGCENWFLLVNTPPDIEVDAESYRDLVLDRLASAGVDLRQRAVVHRDDDAERHRRPLPLARRGDLRLVVERQAGRVPAARQPGARSGLYLVGGSSHPGGGLPLVTTSAEIVADMIAADGSSERRGSQRCARRRSLRGAAGAIAVGRLARAARPRRRSGRR